MPPGAVSPSLFRDGFGTRWLAFDSQSNGPVEILAFAPQFAESAEFGAGVGERVARLARVRHTLYARAQRLDRTSETTLLLYSDRLAGWRLADVLALTEREKISLDISAVLVLLRQLIPAVALFSRHQREAAIGTIGPERLILTPQSRLVLAEYVLAPGVEKMHFSRERLWRELRVALPHAATPARMPPTADVVGMGIVALSLLLGRPLKEDEFLVSLGHLLESVTETSGGATRQLSAGFSTWIARALQFDEAAGLQSPQDAQVSFEEMLAKERGYVTTQVQLDLFVARVEKLLGPPYELPATPLLVLPPEPVDSEPPPEITVAAPEAEVVAPPPARAPATDLVKPASPKSSSSRPVAPAVRSDGAATTQTTTAGWITRPVLAMATVALIEGGVIGWLLTDKAGPALGSHGELVIHSRPVAARVTIDGEDRGITPLSSALSAGAHIVEVRVGRSEPRVIPIEIRAGIQSGLYVELQSVATVGGLDVRTDPVKARVTVDGRYRGDTPLALRDLPPGDHEVLLEAGRQRVRHTVRVEPGITSQLLVPLGR